MSEIEAPMKDPCWLLMHQYKTRPSLTVVGFRVAVAIAAMQLLGGQSSAGIIMRIQDTTIVNNSISPTLGFFDVFFEVSGPSRYLAAYNLSLETTDSGDLEFLEAVESSGSHPAIFMDRDPTEFGTGEILRVADNLPFGQQEPIADGSGLLTVYFSIKPGVTGSFPLEFNPNETFLFDASISPVSVDHFVGGTITVVPEPSALVLSVLACISLAITWSLRRLVSNP